MDKEKTLEQILEEQVIAQVEEQVSSMFTGEVPKWRTLEQLKSDVELLERSKSIFINGFDEQIAAYMDKNKPSVMVRSAPLCGYALANMLRNGLEEEDIPTDAYEIIDRYIPFEELRKMKRLTCTCYIDTLFKIIVFFVCNYNIINSIF